MFDVSTSLLRFWEKEFSKLKPKKNRRGDRQYTKKDIEMVYDLYQLIKVKGYTLEGAKKSLKSNSKTPTQSTDNQTVIAKLEQLKQDLIELKKQL